MANFVVHHSTHETDLLFNKIDLFQHGFVIRHESGRSCTLPKNISRLLVTASQKFPRNWIKLQYLNFSILLINALINCQFFDEGHIICQLYDDLFEVVVGAVCLCAIVQDQEV